MKLLFLLLILSIAPSAHADPAPPDCTAPSEWRVIFECRRILYNERSKVLAELYAAALEGEPEPNGLDNRKGKPQLILSQKAWQAYVDANCDYVGGKQGGSNQWVSYFAFECVLEEVQKRIDFFKNPPHGG